VRRAAIRWLGQIKAPEVRTKEGIAVTLAECCFGAGVGVEVALPCVSGASPCSAVAATLFGESSPRVVVSVDVSRLGELLARAAQARVPATPIGHIRGARLSISVGGGSPVIDIPVADAEAWWTNGLERYFSEAARHG
jgi:phosphoribosylformylglycinamidine (FGAM) synthase-like enzyme